jgi:two-component system chemotaxis sensor kinase CheA
MSGARDPYKYFRIEGRELLDGLSQGVLEIERGSSGPEVIARLLRLAHTLKGASRVVRLGAVAERAHDIETVLTPHRAGAPATPEAVARLVALLDEVRTGLAAIDAVPAPEPSLAVSPSPASALETVRVELDDMDRLLDAVSEAAVQVHGLRRASAEIERVQRLADVLAEHLGAQGGPPVKAQATAAELRESLRRLGRSLTTGVEQAGVELVQVQDAATRLRLLPASSAFPLLERAARDAARAVGRTIDFQASGGSIRLDAHVLGALRDALLHIVRNAVAHGIEPEAHRLAAGKPARGRIDVSVERWGNKVAFVCRDDGRGIDVAALRHAAVRGGILDPNASLSPGDAFRLLLKGGITTTTAVTEVSGRGIGLDVVREVAARLEGDVSVRSEPGRGATFEVVVPVSLSSLQALVVEASDAVASVPLEAVRRTLRIDDRDIARSSGVESVVYEGNVIPFVPLARALGRSRAPAPKTWSAVIVEAASGIAAVGVDRLRGTVHTVVRSLPAHASAHAIVAGAALDAEGTPQIVLDAGGLVASARATRYVAGEAPKARPPVLVIDDSLTTRMLEKSILEAAGYVVETATSAEEGLEKARAGSYGLFLVDVEMPGMDGFQFVAQTRADPTLRDIPAILVTSRSSPSDRERGRRVGARAYVVKGEFDQSMLLSTLRGLIG